MIRLTVHAANEADFADMLVRNCLLCIAMSGFAREGEATSRPTVQLLHTQTDGSTHIDWMLGTDAEGSKPLVTFRLPGRLDNLKPGDSMPAEHIGDHRPIYLTYEGPLSNDRGSVKRVLRGAIISGEPADRDWTICILWCINPAENSTQMQRLRVFEEENKRWRVVCLPQGEDDSS